MPKPVDPDDLTSVIELGIGLGRNIVNQKLSNIKIPLPISEKWLNLDNNEVYFNDYYIFIDASPKFIPS